MTEQRRAAELAHQRPRELVEGVGEDDERVPVPQLVEKLDRPLERIERRDHLLDVRDSEAVSEWTMFGSRVRQEMTRTRSENSFADVVFSWVDSLRMPAKPFNTTDLTR